MTRRNLLQMLSLFGLGSQTSRAAMAAPTAAEAKGAGATAAITPLRLSDADWQKRLSPAAYRVLRHEGTEAPGSSELNTEKRKGMYHCAGCDLPLFSSEAKYNSGTGWPSFFQALPGAVATRTDYKLILPRTEYHCARCEGHQGHVFNDGPKPSGQRFCNNGVALKFEPQAA